MNKMKTKKKDKEPDIIITHPITGRKSYFYFVGGDSLNSFQSIEGKIPLIDYEEE